MVRDDHYQMFGSGKVMSPLFQSLDYCKEFPVVYVVVPLCWGEGVGVICTGMKVSIGIFLHQYSSTGGERGVSHNKEWFGGVWHFDHRCG